MSFLSSLRTARMGLIATLTAAGIALVGAATTPSFASGTKGRPPTTLILGQQYDHALNTGASVQVGFTPGTILATAMVEFLAVGHAGNVVGQIEAKPSAGEINDGIMTMTVPVTTGQVAYWIALDPVDGNDTMHLAISPSGPQPAGAAMAAILTGAPPGDTVYLLGIDNADPDAPGASIALYIPQSACLPDPTSSGMIICNFFAPTGYSSQNVSFEAHTTNDAFESLPVNNLPEAPAAALLPLVTLPVVYILQRRRLAASR